MDMGSVRRWIVLFLTILGAILVADAVSTGIVRRAGLQGMTAYIINFILYAAMLFAAFFILKKYGHIDIFGFGRS
jgi:membrane glycosyltransferase